MRYKQMNREEHGFGFASTHISVLLGCLLLLANFNAIVLAVPCAERSGIHLDDRILHQSLSTNQLIVRGVVDHIQNSGLARHSLRAPREIASVQTQRPELGVPTTHTDTPHGLVAGQLGHSTLPSQLVPTFHPPSKPSTMLQNPNPPDKTLNAKP
jgi:hypothetical protein